MTIIYFDDKTEKRRCDLEASASHVSQLSPFAKTAFRYPLRADFASGEERATDDARARTRVCLTCSRQFFSRSR